MISPTQSSSSSAGVVQSHVDAVLVRHRQRVVQDGLRPQIWAWVRVLEGVEALEELDDDVACLC